MSRTKKTWAQTLVPSSFCRQYFVYLTLNKLFVTAICWKIDALCSETWNFAQEFTIGFVVGEEFSASSLYASELI